jgi:hypothetical protein
MGKKSGSGFGTIFLVKLLKFFDADPEWKKIESGSATLPLSIGRYI